MTEDRSSGRDVVFVLSTETWDDLVKREFARPPDRILRHLMSSPKVRSLLVVHPWRSVAGQLRRRIGAQADARFPTSPREHLLRPVRLRRGDPTNVQSLERSYRAYTGLIRTAARRFGMSDPALISVHPFVPAFGSPSGFSSVTYFGRDDWSSYPPHQHLWPAYRVAYERMRERRVTTCAVSSVLLDRLSPAGPSRVVPNGVDPHTWTHPGEPPRQLAGLPRPWIAYTGTLDGRISVPALQSIRRSVPGGSIILAGPPSPDDVETIKREVAGVSVSPRLSQADLAGMVHASDVCVVPHVRSALTEAMSPLKLYEYLAAGRPVVATDLLPMRGVHPKVSLVGTDDAFGPAVAASLASGPLTEADRKAFIDANSWRARCESVLDAALSEG